MGCLRETRTNLPLCPQLAWQRPTFPPSQPATKHTSTGGKGMGWITQLRSPARITCFRSVALDSCIGSLVHIGTTLHTLC
ncbi:hypothetical protein E2C01_030076 [Portunus trituberculatus]|uniref:Uncharacterized protein n=1 Tax=Portunus trituberculatus TaxID=210409 RepID=A0A5B7ER46_PORTR|nr:hypothetical protein [Portunus trituberculatus]